MTGAEYTKLKRRSRPVRMHALWAAMSPGARAEVWASLDDQKRVRLLAIMFEATDV